MNAIYLDIGNTSLTVGKKTKSGWEIIYKKGIQELLDVISCINNEYSGYRIYVSSVRCDVLDRLYKKFPDGAITVLSTADIPDKLLDYQTIDTLGTDRFFACLGAFKRSKNDVVVIDAGSACTIDFMDGSGVYRGGVIMPGLGILKSSIKRNLPELPIPIEAIPEHWPGKSTQECVQWGLYGMVANSIQSFIDRYRDKGNTPVIYLSGGDAEIIEKLLTSVHEQEMVQQPFLLFEGMEQFVREFKT